MLSKAIFTASAISFALALATTSIVLDPNNPWIVKSSSATVSVVPLKAAVAKLASPAVALVLTIWFPIFSVLKFPIDTVAASLSLEPIWNLLSANVPSKTAISLNVVSLATRSNSAINWFASVWR